MTWAMLQRADDLPPHPAFQRERRQAHAAKELARLRVTRSELETCLIALRIDADPRSQELTEQLRRRLYGKKMGNEP